MIITHHCRPPFIAPGGLFFEHKSMKEFELDARLAMCASFVREGHVLADVGTDHGYMTIRLLLDHRIPFAFAADIRPGPLSTARENARRFGVENQITFCLCDGLTHIPQNTVQDINIAGMGGEMILKILQDSPWACTEGMRLILQPMTMVPKLRRGLAELGMYISAERAVVAANRVYTVICAEKAHESIACTPLWEQMGALPVDCKESRIYAGRVVGGLRARSQGALHEGNREEATHLLKLASDIEYLYGVCEGGKEL